MLPPKVFLQYQFPPGFLRVSAINMIRTRLLMHNCVRSKALPMHIAFNFYIFLVKDPQKSQCVAFPNSLTFTYRTRAIISRGLYFFYPFFTEAAACITDNLCTKNGNSSFLSLKCAASNQEAAYDGARTVIQNFQTTSQHLLHHDFFVWQITTKQ